MIYIYLHPYIQSITIQYSNSRSFYSSFSLVILWIFFKCFLLVLPLFLFTPLNHWTGAALYGSVPYLICNFLFLFIPILILGVVEWDIPERVCSAVPVLYALVNLHITIQCVCFSIFFSQGRRRFYFNIWIVLLWFIEGILWGLLSFYFIYATFRSSILESSGSTPCGKL